jgi:hypothetical protein
VIARDPVIGKSKSLPRINADDADLQNQNLTRRHGEQPTTGRSGDRVIPRDPVIGKSKSLPLINAAD